MFEFNIFALPPLVASLIIISLGIYVLIKRVTSSANVTWFLVCLSIFIWLLSDVLLFSTKNLNLATLFSKFIYVGVTGIPLSMLYFSLKITNTKFNKILNFILPLLYIIIIILVFKTDLIISGFYHYFYGFYPKAGKYHGSYLCFWGGFYLLATMTIYKKMRELQKGQEERGKLIYLFWAFSCAGVIGPLDFIQKYGIEFYPIGYFSVPLIVGFVTYAIIKHNLLDIQIVLKRSIIYSTLIAILTGIYLLLIMLTEWLFRGFLGYKSLIISFSAAFLIALFFNPLRNKIQTLIDHLFLGKSPHEIADENERLRQELERSDRLKATSTLALGLAHEIKNPLTTLKTFSEYLPQKFEDKAFLEKFAKLIPEEVERINSIVHQLLNFSKPTPPSFKDVPIHKLTHDILELLSNDFLKRKIRINEYFDDMNLIIKADPAQLKQALLNLILNAIESMSDGGIISIKTTLRQDNYLEIEISDEGCGIAEKDIKHIFDPFFSTKESGTGLGLSIAYQIIKNHKGKIEVESELGKGTTFRIRLPLAQQSEG